MTVFLKISLSMEVGFPEASNGKTKPHAWLDKKEYPFKQQIFEWNDENIHYIDEGAGSPLVFLHGNPTWSFLYRNFIKRFSHHYRCIAPDYPGFGLSKLNTKRCYTPDIIAESVHELIKNLNLKNITLVVHDWGGPIGVWYAVNHPQNVASVIVMNSWMWPLKDQLRFQIFSRLMSGFPGRYLIDRHNIFIRIIMRFGFGNPMQYSKSLRHHYTKPFDKPNSKKPQWVLASSLLDSSLWLKELWKNKEVVEEIPALFIWGMRDPMFTNDMLSRWSNQFKIHEIIRLKKAGHYVPEEIDDTQFERIGIFLKSVYK